MFKKFLSIMTIVAILFLNSSQSLAVVQTRTLTFGQDNCDVGYGTVLSGSHVGMIGVTSVSGSVYLNMSITGGTTVVSGTYNAAGYSTRHYTTGSVSNLLVSGHSNRKSDTTATAKWDFNY